MSDLLKGLFGGGDGGAANPADAAAHLAGDAGHKAAREARRAERAARKALSPEDRDHLTTQANDFVKRYTTGSPVEGYTGEEALKNFLAVSEYASPEQLQRATQQAVANLPSDQRAAFGKMLEERQQGKGLVDIQRSGQASQGGAAAGGADGGDLFGSILGGLLGAPAGGGAAPQGGGALGDILGQIMGAPSTQGQQGGDLTDILGSLMGAPSQQPQAGGLGDILTQMMGAPAQQAPQPGTQGGSATGSLMDNPLTKMVLGGIAAYAMKEILGGATKGRA